MARAAILANGRLAVGLDENGLVHDFYYPYVGLENLTTARSMHHRIGIWIDGVFSWTDGDDWTCSVDLSSDALTAKCTMINESLLIKLETEDFVDPELDVFCRQITAKNLSNSKRAIRLFMHQVFEISSGGRADTALYEPDDSYILDYKGRVCLLISGMSASSSFDQFAVGNYGIEGKAGTYMDAEDGELSGHPVEHAGVDSVIRFSAELKPHSKNVFDYWVVAGDSQFDCASVHHVMKKGVQQRKQYHKSYWQQWLSISDARLSKLEGRSLFLTRKSLMTIKAHIDQRGGIIASCDSSIYNYGRDYYSYVWPRDGAFAIWPLIRLGYFDEAKRFLNFCNDIMAPDGYMMHKYQPDRAIGSTWHPLVHDRKKELAIQEDETAILIVMLGELYDYSKDEAFTKRMYERFVVTSANFLTGFVDNGTGLPHASYDLWEEKFLTTTYTTAVVYAALLVASELALSFGSDEDSRRWDRAAQQLCDHYPAFVNPETNAFRKGFLYNNGDDSLDFDNTVDMSSAYGVVTFGYLPKNVDATKSIEQTFSMLENHAGAGGYPRYQSDNYFRKDPDTPPNAWIISTLWVAQYYIRIDEFDKAKTLINWVESKAMPSGVFSEQIHPMDGTLLSVTPLVWSHAEYLNTVLDLGHKLKNSPEGEFEDFLSV